jgi:cytochrome c556
MNRIAFLVVVGVLAVVPLTAQAPAGWKLRADNSTNASDPDAKGDISFVVSGSGFHATNPRAAVFWRPEDAATGSYSLKGVFTLLEPSNHTNYYGLVFGGSNLDGPKQQYVYFLVAQDGTWLVKRRDGDAKTDNVLPKTLSSAVKKPDASGRSVNALEVRVTSGAIEFLINDTIVSRWAGAWRLVKTEGAYGIRVNHFLNVQIDGFTATPLATTADRASIAEDGSKRSETVAVTASVARILSPKAFAMNDVAAGSAEQEDQLVVAPSLQAPVDARAPVTVFGTIVPFEVAAKGGPVSAGVPDLPSDVAEKYRGRRAILASMVLSAAMVDLTKPLPPPITADEELLDALMKRIAPAFASLRQAVDGANAAAAKQQAETLDQAFTRVEAFWTTKSRADATGWARTARENAGAIARDAAAGSVDSMKAATATLGQQCQSCHAAYREQFANGDFRIKKSR